MVEIAAHGYRMDSDHARDRVGKEFFERRGTHLQELRLIEDMARELSPLPISYDVTRLQPRFFREFVYTELLGSFYMSPQSSELAARVVDASLNVEQGSFDLSFLAAVRDKYALEVPATGPKEQVIFLPGSNLFKDMVCRETLTRVLNENMDAMIKPHPMTNEETIRQLGRLFGYERILNPKSSGAYYLRECEHAYVTSSTETGLYGVLMGKTVHNIGHIRHEGRGAFHPFYRLIWGASTKEERAARLRTALGAKGSGFIHPHDPEAREKVEAFFKLALELREVHRDFVMEYDPIEYAIMVRGERNEDAIRKGREGSRQPDSKVPDDGAGGSRRFDGVVATFRQRA